MQLVPLDRSTITFLEPSIIFVVLEIELTLTSRIIKQRKNYYFW